MFQNNIVFVRVKGESHAACLPKFQSHPPICYVFERRARSVRPLRWYPPKKPKSPMLGAQHSVDALLVAIPFVRSSEHCS